MKISKFFHSQDRNKPRHSRYWHTHKVKQLWMSDHGWFHQMVFVDTISNWNKSRHIIIYSHTIHGILLQIAKRKAAALGADFLNWQHLLNIPHLLCFASDHRPQNHHSYATLQFWETNEISIGFMTFDVHIHTQKKLILSAKKNVYPFWFIYIVTIWLKSVENEQNLSQRRT